MGKPAKKMPIIESLLDNDLYKFTMQQVVWSQFPKATAEYAFKCRNSEIDLTAYADEIREEIDAFCCLSLSREELDYLRGIRYIKPGYVDSLQYYRLDPSAVEIRTENGFELRVAGNWYQTILFEVPLLAIINQIYFRHTHPFTAEYAQSGRAKLVEKCRMVQGAPTPIAIIEFGTRRRYSRDWQSTVIETMQREIPEFFLGTSNVAASRRFELTPFGTMAHEFLQACQVFAPLPDFQRFALETWMQEYRGDLGIALSDVVGMDAFLHDFDRLFCKAYDGCRHDSGDPYLWGEKLIAHYQQMKLDPATKSAVFSDGLDIPKAIALATYFQGRIRTSFGIGTNLTNDFGNPTLNIVIKMVRCNGQPVAKLSDSPGKTMSSDPLFLEYLRQIFQQ